MPRLREEAQADLASLSGTLYRIPADAWDEFNERHRELRGDYLPRSQANLVHDYMEKAARSLLADEPGIYMPEPGTQTFYIGIRHTWVFRLHKLNNDFTICNNSTPLSLEFLDQDDVQLGLPAMPGSVTNLHLGYLLNVTETGMSSVHIVCPNGPGAYYWEWTLLPEADQGREPVALPIAPQPSEPDRLARPKPSEKPVEQPAKDGSGA